MTQPATRRTLLATGAATLAVCCVGCGDDGDTSSATASTSPVGESVPASSDSGDGQALGSVSEIPEGGGKIFAAQKVVVTQPKKGEYKAFSAICTHQGCSLDKVADGTVDCSCHGSRFRISDGSVAQGPATQPLAAKEIMVHGNTVHLG
ncbi:Rieske (2Fe-2S) protein [Streptomyces griseoluteus]|uniref:Cytochrome bc1 complex Rieske iron-sulfur subunit n=1 Tax=Streptomyces griseoluteus TaxID=29306 RepID=A0A4Z1DEW1_STRGP|nr:Rieske (2Fe-2S) protein [Streptomyces griseoluteus]TGN80600.1 Rieske (2Fe-2S) protein [Streptomyces griseoluteus]GHF22179.1 iron-sulfur protein [Streptomyces griseoluteus]